MKLPTFAKLLVFGIILTIAAVGCRKRPVGVTQLPDYPKTGQVADLSSTPQSPSIDDPLKASGLESEGHKLPDPSQHEKWIENREIFRTDTVHFDYDSSVIKTSEKPKVVTLADHLKGNASTALQIEGHADERGTEEYNRSLGERRALAVREELIKMGIEPSRLTTTSYGKDRPIDLGHNEESHRKNRRGEFVQLTPPKSE